MTYALDGSKDLESRLAFKQLPAHPRWDITKSKMSNIEEYVSLGGWGIKTIWSASGPRVSSPNGRCEPVRCVFAQMSAVGNVTMETWGSGLL